MNTDYQSEILRLAIMFLGDLAERYGRDGCEDLDGELLDAVKSMSPQAIEFLSQSCANICDGWERNDYAPGLEGEQTSVLADATADALERMMEEVTK